MYILSRELAPITFSQMSSIYPNKRHNGEEFTCLGIRVRSPGLITSGLSLDSFRVKPPAVKIYIALLAFQGPFSYFQGNRNPLCSFHILVAREFGLVLLFTVVELVFASKRHGGVTCTLHADHIYPSCGSSWPPKSDFDPHIKRVFQPCRAPSPKSYHYLWTSCKRSNLKILWQWGICRQRARL